VVGLNDLTTQLESNHVGHGAYASKELTDKNEK